MSADARAMLRAAAMELETAVAAFNAEWPAHVRHLELYRLPVLTEQRVPPVIEPVLLMGKEAVALAQHAFSNFGYEAGQHPATAARYPGVLVLRKSLAAQIEAINALKSQVRAIVGQYPPGSRSYIARKTLPGKVLLHMYRRIHVVRGIRRVLWTWAGNTTGSRNVTVEQAAAEVEASRAHPPAGVPRHEWEAVIDDDLRRLAELGPSPRLVFRRRIAPHPRVVAYPHDENKEPAVFHGNLPLVVCAPASEPLPAITPLDKYVEGVRTALRRDRQRLVPVIERIHLYARPPQT